MLGAIREQVRLHPGRGKQLLRGLQQQFPPWQHWWVDGGYRTSLIASLQQELGGTVEPLRPPHALVVGLPTWRQASPHGSVQVIPRGWWWNGWARASATV